MGMRGKVITDISFCIFSLKVLCPRGDSAEFGVEKIQKRRERALSSKTRMRVKLGRSSVMRTHTGPMPWRSPAR